MKTLPASALARAAVFALTLACVPLVSFAQGASREAMVDELMSLRVDPRNQQRLELSFADTMARPAFKMLRSEADWGPEHPTWKKRFPEFGAGFARMMQSLQPVLIERAKAAMVRDLSEDELTEMLAVARKRPIEEAEKLLAQLGLDPVAAVRMTSMMSNPALYSRAEQAELKGQLMMLASREREVQAALPKFQMMLASMRTPAFMKLQQVMTAMASPQSGDMQPDSPVGRVVLPFVNEWRERVKQD